MKPHTVTIPVTDASGRKRFPRVGAMFENHTAETGEVFYTVKLDFPVGATELLVFPPRPAEAAAGAEEGAHESSAETNIETSEADATFIAAQGKA